MRSEEEETEVRGGELWVGRKSMVKKRENGGGRRRSEGGRIDKEGEVNQKVRAIGRVWS